MGTTYQYINNDKSKNRSGNNFTISENTRRGVQLHDYNHTTFYGGGGSVRDRGYILTGPDGHHFEIDSSGRLKTRTVLDYENPVDSNRNNIYEVRVNLKNDIKFDSSSNWKYWFTDDYQDIKIKVNDVHEVTYKNPG